MEFTVRAYQEEDIPAMINLWNEVVTAGQAFPQEMPETGATGASFFGGQSYCGVAIDSVGQVGGLYILHPNNVGRCGHICNASYAVAAAHKRKGIGKMLVLDSLETGKRLGFKIMQFNAVTSDNLAANSLYSSLGFTPLGEIPGGFRRPDGNYQNIRLYYKAL